MDLRRFKMRYSRKQETGETWICRVFPLLVAVNGCDSKFFWSEHDEIGIRRALFKEPNGEECTGEFHESLRCLSGVIVFYHAVLGNERRSRVQLFGNETGEIPEYLHFLFAPQELGALLGIES